MTILCLNINSYSAGVTDAWSKNGSNLGVEGDEFRRRNQAFQDIDFGDGKLEFLTFGSISALSNERFMHGFANRIEQGTGPYRINFKS